MTDASLPVAQNLFYTRFFPSQPHLEYLISVTTVSPRNSKGGKILCFPFSNFMASYFPVYCQPVLPAQGWVTRTGSLAFSQPAERVQALRLWEATA